VVNEDIGAPAPGFSFEWAVEDAAQGAGSVALACETAGVATVRLTAENTDTGQQWTFDFACDDGADTTGTVTIGDYIVTAEAFDAAGNSLSSEAWSTDNFETTELGQVIFLVNL
jgi:hypothetical protein